ncbi:MAG: NYN domain-containing protein [Acidobacteriia bacterium]|nr:NYN domain-containing protein [Terriglobia bacterium]
MDRVAVFIDAGYLFAQGSIELCGVKLPRGQIELDHRAVAAKLKAFAEAVSDLPLLRIYWYDGTSQGPTPQHITLAGQTDVKVRLGFVNPQGQQKGVDSLIVTDMITLARNRAMAECVLLSGDEDLRVGVEQAQVYGIRVHLLGIKPARGSQSIFLLQEADATHEWVASDLNDFLKCTPSMKPETASLGDAAAADSQERADSLDEVAQRVADDVAETEIAALVESIRETNQRPREIDAKLLSMSGRALGNNLDPSQKSKVREAFLSALEARLHEAPDAR